VELNSIVSVEIVAVSVIEVEVDNSVGVVESTGKLMNEVELI
jgi:hypothetical protein